MLIHFYYKTLAYGNIKAHQNYDCVEIHALEKSQFPACDLTGTVSLKFWLSLSPLLSFIEPSIDGNVVLGAQIRLPDQDYCFSNDFSPQSGTQIN